MIVCKLWNVVLMVEEDFCPKSFITCCICSRIFAAEVSGTDDDAYTSILLKLFFHKFLAAVPTFDATFHGAF